MELVTGQQIWDLVHRATQRAGFTADVSEVLADSTTEAELYGKSTVGLNHLFYYFQAATHELVNVAPEVTQQTVTDSMLKTHADHGPLQYAYRHSETALVDATRKHGIAVLMMSHAFAGGELGYFARRLARNGLVSVAFANGPAVMSVGGSFERLLGTNPVLLTLERDGEHMKAEILSQAFVDHWLTYKHGIRQHDGAASALMGKLAWPDFKNGRSEQILINYVAAEVLDLNAVAKLERARHGFQDGSHDAHDQFFGRDHKGHCNSDD